MVKKPSFSEKLSSKFCCWSEVTSTWQEMTLTWHFMTFAG